MWHKGQLARFAASSRDEPDLRLAFAMLLALLLIFSKGFALTVRDESQPVPIRRPAWAMRIALTGDALRLTSSSRDHPDRRTILIRAIINRCDHKGYAPTIW